MSKAETDAIMLAEYGAVYSASMYDDMGGGVRFYMNEALQQRFLVDVSPDGKLAVYTFDRNLN